MIWFEFASRYLGRQLFLVEGSNNGAIERSRGPTLPGDRLSVTLRETHTESN
jgi:hypothetical protein